MNVPQRSRGTPPPEDSIETTKKKQLDDIINFKDLLGGKGVNERLAYQDQVEHILRENAESGIKTFITLEQATSHGPKVFRGFSPESPVQDRRSIENAKSQSNARKSGRADEGLSSLFAPKGKLNTRGSVNQGRQKSNLVNRTPLKHERLQTMGEECINQYFDSGGVDENGVSRTNLSTENHRLPSLSINRNESAQLSSFKSETHRAGQLQKNTKNRNSTNLEMPRQLSGGPRNSAYGSPKGHGSPHSYRVAPNFS